MSISGLATLAATRDKKDVVTRKDLGKGETHDENSAAKTRDLLGTLIPAEAIAAYSALLALVLEYIDGERNKGTNPSNYGALRWLLVAGLLIATAWLVFNSYKKRSRKRKFPKTEVAVALLAAAAWSLSGPGTPLALAFDGITAVVVPTAVLFAVFIALLPLVPKLRQGTT
jgi:hypothetical protein